MDYSTKRISQQLIDDIKSALHSVSYGSIEIFVSDSSVTHITTRTIKKTNTSSKQNGQTQQKKSAVSVSQKKQNQTKKVYPGNIVSVHSAIEK